MSWNYRIIDFGKEGCSLHEVHYDEQGNITARTEKPRKLVGWKPKDVIEDLELMLADAKRLPPLKLKDLPKACR
jgi:hypothetical protein